MSRRKYKAILSIAAASALALFAPTIAAVPEDGPTTIEKLSAPQRSWLFIRGSGSSYGTTIYDSQTGVMKGMVNTSHNSDLAIDPKGRRYYVSETIWSLGNRGERQDLIAIYDSENLKLQAQIKIPGRMMVGGRTHNFILSADGSTGFIYHLSPASTVNVVDLERNKFLKTIELPGCATLIPNKAVGFSALCSDGSIATVDYRTDKKTRTAPFFSATDDPIFDNYNYDPARETAVFLSYTGLIYTAQMGANPTVSEPFSLQEAAGYSKATTQPLNLAYYPGGDQPSAWHVESNRLFVLVHAGEYWSHIEMGTQLWVVDLARKKVVKKIKLPDPVNRIEITQGPKPLLYLSKGSSGSIIDPETGTKVRDLSQVGSGVLMTLANAL